MIKKTLIGLLLVQFGLAATARAEAPNVTWYGKIDVFTEFDRGGSLGSRTALESGGLVGSRWGVKGSGDLSSVASDLKAIFQVEGGDFVNNGRQAQGGRLFGRQAYAGVEGNFGTVTAGRQYTPLLNTVVGFDSFGQGFGSPANDGNVSFGLDSRYDNAIIYATPNLGGLTASAMVALGGQTGNTNNNMTGGFNVGYATGPFEVGFAYQKDDHFLANASSVTNGFGGASYKFANTKIMGGVGNVRTSDDAGLKTRRNEWLIGAQVDVTSSGQFWIDYGQGKTRDAAVSDKGSVLSVAWVETLTPAAKVYAVLSSHKNDEGSALVPVGTSSSGAYTIAPGDSARALALGFQYSF